MNVVKHIQWGAEYAAYRAMETLFACLSAETVFDIGHHLGTLTYYLFGKRRHIVIHNLRVAFGDELSLEQIHTLARDVFSRSGSNLLSSFRTSCYSEEELRERMHFSDLEEFHRLHRDRKGVVLLVPHMGNWELLAQAIRYLEPGDQLATHYRKLNNPYLNARVEAERSKHGTQLFSKHDSPHAIVSLLREGGAIGILADQRAGKAGYWASYYDRFTTCSPLPEVLAKRTGAEVALMYIRTTGIAQWEVTVETLKVTNTLACMDALERATRHSPSDVFWFQDRWRLPKSNPFKEEGKRHPLANPSEEGKPLRLLHWNTDPAAPLPALPPRCRPVLQLEVVHPEGQTPPAYAEFPWSHTWPTDPSVEPESYERFLKSIDEADRLPLDGIVLTAPHPDVQQAAKRAGLSTWVLPPADS